MNRRAVVADVRRGVETIIGHRRSGQVRIHADSSGDEVLKVVAPQGQA